MSAVQNLIVLSFVAIPCNEDLQWFVVGCGVSTVVIEIVGLTLSCYSLSCYKCSMSNCVILFLDFHFVFEVIMYVTGLRKCGRG